MNIELKDFQEDAVRFLLRQIRHAQQEVREGIAQAIVLSSPTGSGKTATLTALIERLLQGDETRQADSSAVFLWLSDSPELNLQSRDKILAQSTVFKEQDLVVIEVPFDCERLEAGKIYFLNIQKLGRDSLLTRKGDEQHRTIWEIIENTAQGKPDHFYMVIDEAHRGMNLGPRETLQARSIVQKFIFGDPEAGISPIKLIIGMSATPQRFERVIEGSNRIKRPYEVPPAAARESGLLKDRIVLFCAKERRANHWTMLSEAVKRYKVFSEGWREYCESQGIRSVDPVLVIQVEDRSGGRVTATDLAQVLGILERELGHLNSGEIAHCFEVDGALEEGDIEIRKIEPSRIQQDGAVRVVLFKMALSTGWDCPRAEVMMSFRKANDPTSIAQLVGRMVRTPLARRIEGNDILNTVSLYLPHYDSSNVSAIVDKLNDPENAPPTTVVDGTGLVTLKRDSRHQSLFGLLEGLPSYCVERVPKTSNTRRLIKLGRTLAFDEVNEGAWKKSRKLVIDTLLTELRRLEADPKFDELCKEKDFVEMRVVEIEGGDWKEIGEGRTVTVEATPENIDDLFERCGRMLGEGMHMEFWKKRRSQSNPRLAKLELIAILQDEGAWHRLEKAASDGIDQLFERHQSEIDALVTSRREEYHHIRRRAKTPQTIPLLFPSSIEVAREHPQWRHHLYVDENGLFGWDADRWEEAVLNKEMRRKGFVAWFRNMPRKPYSLCINYTYRGEERAMYPDLVTFQKVSGRVKVNLLDPHGGHLPDAVHKAVGLARFAEKHGSQFGRIEVIRLGTRGQIQALNVNREATRNMVKQAQDSAYLDALFQGHVSGNGG